MVHTMLRIFQEMNSVNAHPVLPQSDSGTSGEEFVQRGYSIALQQSVRSILTGQRARRTNYAYTRSNPRCVGPIVTIRTRSRLIWTHPVLMNASITIARPREE